MRPDYQSTSSRSARRPGFDPAAIREIDRIRRIGRHQAPGAGQVDQAEIDQHEGRRHQRRIIVVQGQHATETLRDSFAAAQPRRVAAAAHDVRRAENGEGAAIKRRARRRPVEREFTDIAAERLKGGLHILAHSLQGQQACDG